MSSSESLGLQCPHSPPELQDQGVTQSLEESREEGQGFAFLAEAGPGGGCSSSGDWEAKSGRESGKFAFQPWLEGQLCQGWAFA